MTERRGTPGVIVSLVRVGWRGAFASAWRSLILLGVGLATLGYVLAVEVDAHRTAIVDRHSERANGANVLIVESTEGQLSSRSCEALKVNSDVVASGGIYATQNDTLNGVPARLYLTTPGVVSLILDRTDDAHGSGAWVGEALSAELGLAVDSELRLSSGDVMAVAGVIDAGTTRSEQFTRSVVVTRVVDAPVTECFLEMGLADAQLGAEIIRSRFVNEYSEVVVRPLVFRGDGSLSATERFLARPTQAFWLVAGALGGLVLVLVLRARRSDIGLLAVLGFGRDARRLIVLVELVGPLLFGYLMAWLAVLVFSAAGQQLPRSTVALATFHLASACGTALIVGVAGIAALDRGDRMILLKDT